MKQYKAIIYDIDGTILDTLKMNMIPLMKIIQEETNEIWTYEEVLKFAPYPGMKVMEELHVKNKEETYARWVQYVNDYPDGATIYDGFEEVFQTAQSKHILQAVVSSKTKQQYQIDMVDKGLDQYMAAVVLAEDTQLHKPHPAPLLECLQRLQVDASEAIYIGDALSDYESAKQAHMDFGYATWGSVSDEGITHPDLVFHTPLELLNLLHQKSEREKMMSQEPYDCGDAELLALWHKAKDLAKAYHLLPSQDLQKKREILKQLLGGFGEELWITSPFYVDYGCNIYFGNHCEVNMNCTFLDDNIIRIGDHVLIAPNVQIYTAYHPTHYMDRVKAPDETGFQFCETITAPVTIGNHVWIGGGAMILPGVTIGDNVVIGAGSVVTKDIPSNMIAYGNPCRVVSENKRKK